MKSLLSISILLLTVFTACGTDSGRAGRDDAKAGAVTTALQKGNGQPVAFTTSDGIVIKGTLYAAGNTPAPAVLCLHQWRSDRSSYRKLAATLSANGFSVLAIDMRGYGESVTTSDGNPVRPDRQAVKDIEAAVAFLRAHPSVEKGRIGIVGASYGSSNAVIYASRDAAIKTLVLLSPGLNYFHVLPTEDAVRAYGSRPMLAVASSEDVRSVEAVDAYKKLGGKVSARIYDNAGHGTEILDAKAELTQAILEFLRTSL